MTQHPFDDWADIYDRVYAYLDYDLPFYVQQAQAAGGPVLELGCGTGRVALAMAEQGHDVVGVDISPKMVAQAQAKADAAGLTDRVRFEVGDMLDVDAGSGFALVTMPFRSFQSMLTIDDQRQALANAAAQLRESGLLAFDIFVPDVEQLGAHDEAVPFHVRDVEQPDGGRLVIWGQNTWDGVEQLNEARLIIDELDPEGRTLQRLYRDFPQRYTFRYEMQHLLELSGFTVEAVYGDFDGGPVTEGSDDLVLVARLTGGA
ncbi:MAG: class I SAM-dependent methyltransferase [Dehalococcoidia bacterium]